MWVFLALLSAAAAAATTFLVKGAVGRGGVVYVSAGYRAVAGVVLALLVLLAGPVPAPTAAYGRLAALVFVPEVAGVLCMAAALRLGELSRVQPLFGTLPMFVMLSEMAFLGARPTAGGGAGVALVVAGVYLAGLRRGMRWWEPLADLGRSAAGRYALAASLAWTCATLIHPSGIRAVGPLPWATTLAFSSAAGVVLLGPLVTRGAARTPAATGAGWWPIALAGALFAVQQVGLQFALRDAAAGYVVSLTATSTVLSTLLGVVVLGEREGSRRRVAAAAMVAAGAALIGVLG